jgi:hypothetical protein
VGGQEGFFLEGGELFLTPPGMCFLFNRVTLNTPVHQVKFSLNFKGVAAQPKCEPRDNKKIVYPPFS